jgi:hypothetical protein
MVIRNLAYDHVIAIVEVVQLVAIKAQVALWKPRHHSSICWVFFVVNDNLLVDIVNPQMLICIICRSEQANDNVLIKSCYIIRKGLIKYNKCNGVTPMKTHIDCVHPKLLAIRKKQLTKVIPLDHTQQRAKKKVGVTSSAIIEFFGSSNPYKQHDEQQQKFFENLVLYICKGYTALSTCENILVKKVSLMLVPLCFISILFITCGRSASCYGYQIYGHSCFAKTCKCSNCFYFI